MKGITICSTQTPNGADEINGILIERSTSEKEFELVCGIVRDLPQMVDSTRLSRAWKCSVYGTVEWIGYHLALLDASGGDSIRPVGTRLQFTYTKPAKKSRK